MALRHIKIKILLPFLSFLAYVLYTSGAISNSKFTKAPITLIFTISSSFYTFFWMKAFGMSMIATPMYYCVYMAQIIITASVATVGELTYSFRWSNAICFHPPLFLTWYFRPYLFWDRMRLQNCWLFLVGNIILASWLKCVSKMNFPYLQLHQLS